MAKNVSELLNPATVSALVQQAQFSGSSLQRLFGWGFSGTNRRKMTGRQYRYRQLSHPGELASGRLPGTETASPDPQSGPTISDDFLRAAETSHIKDEDLMQARIFVPDSQEALDEGIERHITRKEIQLAQRFVNFREYQTAALLHGQYSYSYDEDFVRYSYGHSGSTNISYNIPASHRDKLAIEGSDIITASWATPSTDIPKEISEVNAAMVRSSGMGISNIVVNGTMWEHIINNTKVKELGGSEGVISSISGDQSHGDFSAKLRAFPWLTFYVVDYEIPVWNGSSYVSEKAIPDEMVAFIPRPSSTWAEYIEGSEVVASSSEEKHEAFGFHMWANSSLNPSGWDLNGVDNGVVALYNPTALAVADVLNFV
ncbi:MAG: major capsid protein [Pirellulaceae bacterium]|nr:major capsid protein [Pirellulaceae bacterium]